MNQENVTIKCEKCGEPANINNALTNQLEKSKLKSEIISKRNK
jgi:hypothetical protein